MAAGWPRSHRAVHALPSAVREVSGVSGVSDREPCGPLRSHPLSVGPPCDFGQLRYLRYRNRPRRTAGATHPVRRQAAGRAARCLPQPFGLGSTMHRAATRGSNATGRLYNYSALSSITALMIRPVSFSRLLGLRRGPHLAGRTGDDATSRVPGPSASNAFKPTRRPARRQLTQWLHRCPRPAAAAADPRVTQRQPVKTAVTSY